MATYRLTALNTSGALKVETNEGSGYVKADFLIPDDIAVNYDLTNSVVNIGTGAIQFQFTVANTVNSSDVAFANFAALKTFIEGIFFLGEPKIYRALLNQTGSNAPTAYVLENTLGETPAFAYANTGQYTLTTSGNVFTADKTYLEFRHRISVAGDLSNNAAFWFDFQWASATTINIYSISGNGISGADDALVNTEITIYVYP